MIKSFFPPCTLSGSLLEAELETARNSVSGGAVLLSPALSRVDQFRNQEQTGEKLYAETKSISRGVQRADPNIMVKNSRIESDRKLPLETRFFAPGFFEEKPRRKSAHTNNPTKTAPET
jgi:hypothetical protein